MMKMGKVVVMATTILLALLATGSATAQAEWRYYGKSSWGCVALEYEGGDPATAYWYQTDGLDNWSFHRYRLKQYGKNYWGGKDGVGDYLDIKPQRRKAIVDYGTTASRRAIPRISKQQLRSLCPTAS